MLLVVRAIPFEDFFVDCFFQKVGRDSFAILTECNHFCFTAYSSNISSRKADCLFCQRINRRFFHRISFQVQLEKFFSGFPFLRNINSDLTVKTSGTEQGRVKRVCSVSCCNHQNITSGIKAVQFCQHSIDSLVILTIASLRTTFCTNSINLIEEQNARCKLSCHLEQVTDTFCTKTNIHFDKFAGICRNKIDTCLMSNCFCKHRFTCASTAFKQNTVRQVFGSSTVFQLLYQQFEVVFDFIMSNYIVKRHINIFGVDDMSKVFAGRRRVLRNYPEHQNGKEKKQSNITIAV